METYRIVFLIYALFGIFLIIFSSFISNFLYNLVLYYTNKVNLKDFFLFKVNHKNKDSLFSLAKYFTCFFGFFLFLVSVYFLYFNN